MSKAFVFALLFATAVAPAVAQPSLGGPQNTLIYESYSRTIRRIVGIPGAAYLGTPLLRRVAKAWPSPDGKYALINLEGGEGTSLYSFDGEYATVIEAYSLVSDAFWSSDSQGFATVTGDTLRTYRNVTAEGYRVQQIIPITGRLLAVDGPSVAYTMNGDGLYWAEEGTVIRKIDSSDTVSCALFRKTNGGKLLVIGDEQAKGIRVFSFGAGIQATYPFGVENDQLVSLAAARDGNSLYILVSGSNTVYAMDWNGGEIRTRLSLPFVPDGLYPLSGQSESDLYLVRTSHSRYEPSQVLTMGQSPNVRFIPAVDEQ